MTNYSFTCAITGCGVVMKASAEDKEHAANMLIGQAKAHLASVHPDIKKTDEEISADIHSHMVAPE